MIQGPRATHVSVGRSAGVGTAQFQSLTQTETGNRRRPSSDRGNVQRLMVPSNGSGR